LIGWVTPLIITTGVRIDQASHDSPLERPMKNSACLDDALAFVERARRFIENEHARLADERASDGNALALAAGQAGAALADDGVIGLRQLEDELVRSRKLRGVDDPLDRQAGIGIVNS
jgi:hypothetical protein